MDRRDDRRYAQEVALSIQPGPPPREITAWENTAAGGSRRVLSASVAITEPTTWRSISVLSTAFSAT
ncbi:hypothetical protein ESCO_001047 [Escovopsis weberi]|uniref:Uncharacterized protein n=1 Tax=Escovopsis weberi TaxID=150374 RepID=A0A0M8MU01_ESCWE|nr:hypothetical protein ESCO_001047 [Escovopsis weberi]